MVRCWAAAQAISDMIVGKLDPEDWIKPFLPARLLLPALVALRADPNMDSGDE